MASLRGSAAAPVPALAAVVKLGGSLASEPALPRWLAAIAEGLVPRLVVPGGGPFADAVRALQPRLGFDERTAHGAAILAMQQYALVLAAIEPRLVPVEGPAEIAEAARAGRSMLWLPWATIGRDPTIEASWRVTSDSLSLLLAIRLAVPELLLVKAATLPPAPIDLERLAAQGILDEAFPELARTYRGRIRLAALFELGALEKGGLEPSRAGLPHGNGPARLRESA